jgi:uncharacterized protein (TIGR03083 family)
MTIDYLDHLRRESARFLDPLRDGDPSARVPSCPDWDADDLLWHLGTVQRFWGTIVADRLQSPEGVEDPTRPGSHGGLVDFFEESSARLQEALTAADPEEPVWMWADDKTVGYIRRRQAHEALIHRLDAELTRGQTSPLDAELAADGILEVLDMMFGGCPPWGSFTPSPTHVAVRATDTGSEVRAVLGRFTGTDPEDGKTYDDDELSVRAAQPSAEPAAVISGTADDLDAWLWHRRDQTSIRLEGDAAVLDRLTKILGQPLD